MLQLARLQIRFRSFNRWWSSRTFPRERAFRELPKDGSWAFVEGEGPNIVIYPPNIIPWELGTTPAFVPDDPEIKRAEELEMRESDPALAAQRYRDLLRRAEPDRVSEIKHRLARSLRNAHQEHEAAQLWREIAAAGGRIGVLPADLVAGFELASMNDDAARTFYRHLDEGVWRIEKPRYLFYLSAIRERLGENQDIPDRVQLAEAVEAAAAAPFRVLGSEASSLIVRETDRLTRLVENALDFARMEEGRKEYRFERLDTAAWLGGVAEGSNLKRSAPATACTQTFRSNCPR